MLSITLKIFIILIILPLNVYSNITDSLWSEFNSSSIKKNEKINILFDLVFELRRTDPDSAIVVAYKGIEIAEKLNIEEAIPSFEYLIGLTYKRKGMIAEALSEFRNIVSQLDGSDKNNARQLMASTLNTMGCIYRETNQLDSSRFCLESAKKIFEETDDIHNKITNINDLGLLYLKLNKVKMALDHFDKAYALSIDNHLYYLSAFTKTFILEAKYKSNSILQNKMMSDTLEMLISKINNSSEKSSIFFYLGVMYKQLSNNKLASYYLNRSLSHSKSTNNEDIILKSYYYLDSIYVETNVYELAYKNLLEYFKFNDSINKRKMSEKIEHLKISHENKIQSKRIKDLEVINNINSNLNITFEIIVVMLIVIFFLLYKRYKSKKKLNVELRKMNETKDRFFSIISHDLKGPANSSLLLLRMLNKDIENFSYVDLKDSLQLLEKSNENLCQLLENLLSWSRSQMGDFKYYYTEFDLAELVEITIENYKSIAKEKDISINFIKVSLNNQYNCHFDRDSIYTVLRNLISNALKFTEVGGKIEITIENKENTVKISIKDNGIGIEETILDNLFSVDKKIITSGTKGEKGTGLGLILCKEFLENNRSSLLVESKVNIGTKFEFSLSKNQI